MAGQSRSNPYASLGSIDSGIVTPGTSGTTFPSKPCRLAKFKGYANNVGYVSIGKPGLAAGGASTGGLILAPREESGWFPVTNINLLGCIATDATDKVEWITLT